jgi:hypothetical protein
MVYGVKMSTEVSVSNNSILDAPMVSRIRRNHGLEHATLHLLAEKYPRTPLAGHSDWNGFWVLGNVPTEELRSSVQDALQRLRNGERSLAVHPNCGTNLATSGIFAGLAAGLAMFGAGRRLRDKLDRLPAAIMLSTFALLLAQPVGLLIQERVTTSGEPGNLQVTDITLSSRGQVKAHRVLTQG